jgi:hypothetical protein
MQYEHPNGRGYLARQNDNNDRHSKSNVNASSHSVAKPSLTPAASTEPAAANKQPFDKTKIKSKYTYNDVDGKVLFTNMYDCHGNSAQARPVPGKPKELILNPKNVEHVPYNLPLLVTETCKEIYVVGNERNADDLNQFHNDNRITDRVATTSVGGVQNVKKWSKFIKKYKLADRQVTIIPGNDEESIVYCREVRNAFVNAGCKNVKLLSLPVGRDISEYIALRRGEGK